MINITMQTNISLININRVRTPFVPMFSSFQLGTLSYHDFNFYSRFRVPFSIVSSVVMKK